ncbi:MAG TPA: indolepyruvate oxidoreductase subunit beta [Firmicutes bacterium]|nr:indolepyruvate oxidoreductase subunit beta [Bacillota bacterium]
MPEPTTNILLAGVGGQGVVLAGRIICAALQAAGYDVKQAEVHGMAQRGGSVVAQIRFGQEVRSPLFGRGEAQVMLAFELLEGLRHLAMLAPGGTVILNDQAILPMPVVSGLQRYPEDAAARLRERTGELLVIQALEVAAGLGNPRAANTVMVGALAGWLARADGSRLTREGWLAALDGQVPEPHREVNRQAFLAGYAVGKTGA